MTVQQLIERDLRKLRSNIRESERQVGFAGSRFGVFAELRRLEKERRRTAKRLIARDPEHCIEYMHHLFS